MMRLSSASDALLTINMKNLSYPTNRAHQGKLIYAEKRKEYRIY
jgi:hypothetical protein